MGNKWVQMAQKHSAKNISCIAIIHFFTNGTWYATYCPQRNARLDMFMVESVGTSSRTPKRGAINGVVTFRVTMTSS